MEGSGLDSMPMKLSSTARQKRDTILHLIVRHWKLGAGLLLIACLLFAARHVPVGQWLETVVQPLRDMGVWGVLVYALVYFIAAMCCLPCMPLTLAGGYIFGTWKGVLAVHSACTLAAACGFLIGKKAGRRHAAEWLKESPRFHFIESIIAQEGWKIVGLLRMHPLPFGLSNYLYGMTALDFWRYLLATTVAMLPGHFIYVHIGSLGKKHLTGNTSFGLLEVLAPALGIASMVALTFVFTRIVRRHRSQPSSAE